ncbi:ROK family protein [Sphingobacterium spiritivorum ATCC 33300]|uniref:ROK family protein n=1 Tax=Sphingobacterium spiritivorum ATCC 33300 TaxID=525372 RepID=C2FZK5_SPHSI|nr:ROK family protein [Sphingobacterium spiritivorum]EEI91451.1 ROK family protein [Sphingobacterium spiritivorum ATCC 33300]QQS97182.1 ROK family protein [Sphingobacterium spiritivorum]
MEKSNLSHKELILSILYYNKSHSIADLSIKTRKSIPSISKIINELHFNQLIIEGGLAPSTGGRRPTTYCINSNLNKYILSVAIDQHYSRAVIFNLSNEALTPVLEIENNFNIPDIAFQNIIDLIKQTLEHDNYNSDNVLGIGISMPGFVDTAQGTNGSFKDKNENLYNIKLEVENRFQIPTYLENDSTAIAIAEQYFGKAKDTSHALIINIGWGVGLGIIVDNKLFRGYSGYAGEFSHIPLSASDKLCSCGKRGCLEVEASLSAAIQFSKERLEIGEKSILAQRLTDDKPGNSHHLIQSALEGDQLAISALAKCGYMLGKGIATLIHILNPEKIILSGRGSQAGSILMPQIQTAMNEFCIPRIARKTAIRISELTDKAQLIGSACIVLEYSLSKFANLTNQ